MKINVKRIIKMVEAKDNRIKSIACDGKFFYPTDGKILLKIPVSYAQELGDYSKEWQGISIESINRVMDNAEENASNYGKTFSRQDIKYFIEKEGKEFYPLSEVTCINLKMVDNVRIMLGLKKISFQISQNDLGPVYGFIDGITFCIAPARRAGENHIKKRMKKALDSKDFQHIEDVLSVNENKDSRKAFEELTGYKLSPTKKVRMEQIASYFGIAWTIWKKELAEQEKARQEAIEKARQEGHKKELETILDHWNDNKFISGSDFVKLCNEYGVKMHIRTQGYCNKSLVDVRKDGRHRYYKKTTDSFWNAFHELNKVLEAKAA